MSSTSSTPSPLPECEDPFHPSPETQELSDAGLPIRTTATQQDRNKIWNESRIGSHTATCATCNKLLRTILDHVNKVMGPVPNQAEPKVRTETLK